MKRKYMGDSQSDIEKIKKKAFILDSELHKRKLENDEILNNKRFKIIKNESISNEFKELNDSILEDIDDIPSIKINHPDILNFNEHSLEDKMYSLDEVVTIMRKYKSNIIRELEILNIRYHVKKHDLEGIGIY